MIEEIKKSISDRDIKFRVRNKEELCFELNIVNIYTIKDYLRDNNTSNKVFMQYTGLKDKNGKEIYEGDIVYFSQYKKNAIVVYEDCKYVLYRTDSDRPRHIPKYTDLYCREGEIEVIGNIYENEDLLS